MTAAAAEAAVRPGRWASASSRTSWSGSEMVVAPVVGAVRWRRGREWIVSSPGAMCQLGLRQSPLCWQVARAVQAPSQGNQAQAASCCLPAWLSGARAQPWVGRWWRQGRRCWRAGWGRRRRSGRMWQPAAVGSATLTGHQIVGGILYARWSAFP